MEEDWEMLQKSDTGLVPASDSAENSREFQVTDGVGPEGEIRSDYFALDSDLNKGTVEEEEREDSSVGSNNPSSVDPPPHMESRHVDEEKGESGFVAIEVPRRNSGEISSDSSCNESSVRKPEGFDGKGCLGHGDDAKGEVHFGGIGVVGENIDKVWSNSGGDGSVYQISSGSEEESELGHVDDAKRDVGFEAIDIKHKISREFRSEKYGGVEAGGGAMEIEAADDGSICSGRVEVEGGESSPKTDEAAIANVAKSEDEEKKRVVWWKLPLELLKFCAFRISPVWSFSIAAAVMGFVILGRRLYKLKHKTRSIQLKVSMDDKKVSQFKSRAARLNEAFSVVKRVPVVRASLPAAGGVTPWPVMSLR